MKVTRKFCFSLVGGLVALMAMSLNVLAQQETLYSQYMFNRLVINPAYAGTKGVLSATGLYRHQWSEFDGAPRTFSFSIHGGIEDRSAKFEPRYYKHGLGAFVLHDKHGAMRNLAVGANYAYRINLDPGYLSFGLQAALLQWTLEGKNVRTFQPNDPVFPSTEESVILPDFGAGVFFNTGRFYLGGSVAHLVPFQINLEGADESQLFPHFFVTSGYDIATNKANDFIISPSVMIRAVQGAPVQADLNANFMFIQKFWVGASYRTEDAVAFLAGFYPHPQVRVGYAYDLSTTDLGNYHSGSHEIMLSIDFGDPNRVRVVTPRYF